MPCPHNHCLHGAGTGIVRCVFGLNIFKNCNCAELNKIVEAMMPVNPYRTGIVYSSEGKCNRGINEGRKYAEHSAIVLTCIQR